MTLPIGNFEIEPRCCLSCFRQSEEIRDAEALQGACRRTDRHRGPYDLHVTCVHFPDRAYSLTSIRYRMLVLARSIALLADKELLLRQ
jgi:hypothetical protein